MVKLNVRIGRLKLENPVMVASGTFGPEYGELVDINRLGALVLKTITLKPRVGNPPPRVTETASGMLNSIGLENGGVEDFIKTKIPLLKMIKVPIIASIAGSDEREFARLAGRLGKVKKIAALELNLSCPNVKYGNREGLIAQDEKATFEIVRAARRATTITLVAKLAPNVTDITKIAAAAKRAGADAVTAVNTFMGMAVDIDAGRPVLGNVTGGLSGPAIKPLALKAVFDIHRKVGIPVIGSGGIMNHEDAAEFFLCGARAVQVGTANFVNPKAPIKILEGLKIYMKRSGIDDINKLAGRLEIGA